MPPRERQPSPPRTSARCIPARRRANTILAVTKASSGDRLRQRGRRRASARRDLASGEPAEDLEVAAPQTLDDLAGETWCGWLLVPPEAQHVIAHELLVERRLRPARPVGLGGPEPRRVR